MQPHSKYEYTLVWLYSLLLTNADLLLLLCTGKLHVQTPATPLSERTLLTQDEIDALQKLIEGTEVNTDAIIATGQDITLEEAHQLLAQKGYIEDTGNLKTRLKESKLYLYVSIINIYCA